MAAPIQKNKEKNNIRIDNIETVFSQAGIQLTKKKKQQLLEWQTHFTIIDIRRALQEAVNRRILNWPYVNGILRSWQQKGSQGKRSEYIPDWFNNRGKAVVEDVIDEALLREVQAKIAALG